jgi:signal transduction histidine kinase
MTPVLGFAPSLRLGAGLRTDVAGEVADQALAVLREAHSNAARHAQATQVDVIVNAGKDTWSWSGRAVSAASPG